MYCQLITLSYFFLIQCHLNTFVYINYKGIPDPPFDLSIVALSWGSAELTWKAGFDGGNSQTFIISVYSDTGDYHEVIANTTEGNVTGE